MKTQIRMALMVICMLSSVTTHAQTAPATPAGAPTAPAAAPAATQKVTYNCAAMANIPAANTITLSPTLIQYCRERGWDPPGAARGVLKSWRPAQGRELVRFGSAETLAVTAMQRSDGSMNDGKSDSTPARTQFALRFPPWVGFPCQLPGGTNICGNNGGSGGAGAAGSCPIASDTSGTFGEVTNISADQVVPLPCGGSVNLTGADMSLVPGASGIAIIDGGNTRIQIYRLIAAASKFELLETWDLPASFYTTDTTGATVKAFDTPPLIPQIVSFAPSSSRLVLRTAQPADVPPATDPSDEQYVTLPLANGRIQLPSNGNTAPNAVRTTPGDYYPNRADFYKPRPAGFGDLWIQPQTSNGCLDTSIDWKSGSCAGDMVFANLATPVLGYQPGQSARILSVDGRTETFAVSTANSFLMVQPETTMRLGSGSGQYIFTDGVRIRQKDGTLLVLEGPATITPSNGQIKADGGGFTADSAGNRVAQISPGRTITANADFPYVVMPERRVIIPAGMLFPTGNNPKVRKALDVPAGS
jgi:hypothetical protein